MIKPSLIQHSIRKPSRSLGFLLLLLFSPLLPGCARHETSKDLDFRFALPDTWEVDRVDRLDTDEDGENEWVILYSFDNPGNRGVAPISGAIYDISRREPKLPIIYPYHLQAPGWSFLGEGIGQVTVRMEDVVTVDPRDLNAGTSEIIVESIGAGGRVTRVSLYRWMDTIPPNLRKRTDPHEILLVQGKPVGTGEWYQCIGMFVGSLRVELRVDRVIVVDQQNDRSQLAVFREYSPKSEQNGYLTADYELASPDSVCINFAHGMSVELAQSPYPEKIVMAYHNTFNQDPLFGTSYLAENAQKSRGSGLWDVFGPSTRDVCVKRISYTPAQETISEITSYGDTDSPTTPPVTTQPITARVQTTATYKLPGVNQPQRIEIEWTLIRESSPPGEQEVWKIDSIREMR